MNRVELAPRARAQVRLIDGWWRENRLAAPTLFAEELAHALEQLERGVTSSHPSATSIAITSSPSAA